MINYISLKKKIKNKINIAQIFQYFDISGFSSFFFFFFVIFPYFPLIFNLELIYYYTNIYL